MVVVTVFLPILNQIEVNLVQNRKENCHHDHIPFNVKGNGNIVFSAHHTGKSNLDKANKIRIVNYSFLIDLTANGISFAVKKTFFLVQNKSKKCNYNPNSV